MSASGTSVELAQLQEEWRGRAVDAQAHMADPAPALIASANGQVYSSCVVAASMTEFTVWLAMLGK